MEARSLHGHETKATFVKGKVLKDVEGKLTVSIEFPEKGQYEVTTTVGGVPRAEPFCVQVKERFHSPRRKLALLGENYESVHIVAKDLYTDNTVTLWGFPVSNTDKKLWDAVVLASMNNAGTYLYIWNYEDGNLCEDNLWFWLSHLKVKAPDAEVIFVGLHLDPKVEETLNEELERFRKSHPKMSVTILMGSSSKQSNDFAEKVLSRVQMQSLREPVWFEVEQLAMKIDEMRKSGRDALTRTELKDLAKDCDIGGENQSL